MNDRPLAPFNVEYLRAVTHEHSRYLDCGGDDSFSGWLVRRSETLEARIEALEGERRLYRHNITAWTEEIDARDTRIEALEKALMKVRKCAETDGRIDLQVKVGKIVGAALAAKEMPHEAAD